MYNKELETSKDAWVKHQQNLKAAASERLKKNATYKKAHKKSTKEE